MSLHYPQMNWNYNPYSNYPYQLPVNPYDENLMADGSHLNAEWADGPVDSGYGHDSQEYNHDTESMVHISSGGHEVDNGGGHSSGEDDGYLHHTSGKGKYRKPQYSHPAPHKYTPIKHYGKVHDSGHKTIHYQTKYISDGGHSSGKKANTNALTALTLLGFFFFLNLLHGCVKEHMDAINPTVMILTPNAMHKSFDKPNGMMDSREKLSVGASVVSSSASMPAGQMDYVLVQPSNHVVTLAKKHPISPYNDFGTSFSNSAFSTTKQQIFVTPTSNHQYSPVSIKTHSLATSHQFDFDDNLRQVYTNTTESTAAIKPHGYQFHSKVISLRMPQIIDDEQPEYYDASKHAKPFSNQGNYDPPDPQYTKPYRILPQVTFVTVKPIMIWTAVSTNFRNPPFITTPNSNEDNYGKDDDTDLYSKPIYTQIT